MYKKRVLLFFPVLLLMLLSSCTRTFVGNTQDELKENVWSGKGEYMSTVDLRFEVDKAALNIKAGGGAKTKIAGDCIVSGDQITLTDKTLKESFTFRYNLLGDQIELTLNDKTITLDKVK